MTEADLQRLVTDAAELYGWTWAHFRPAQTARGWRTPVQGPMGQGFPDLIMLRVRDRRLMVVELKADKGRVSDQQAFVHEQMIAAGVDLHVVRPKDFDEFLEVLR